MATDKKEKVAVTIAPGNWCDEAVKWAAQAVDENFLPEIRLQVEAGSATLFFISVDGEICGCTICRIDRFSSHSEGVIMVASGYLKGIDLIATVMPEIEKKFIGCRTIRFHTGKAAIAKKMHQCGYIADEIICRKELSNGQI